MEVRMWAAMLLWACAPGVDEEAVAEAPWTPPGEAGPYAPGVTHLVIDDPRGGTIDVEVWYPARPEPGATPDPYEELPITLGAFRDAPPVRDQGPFPLLAFSHGFGGIRYQSATLTEHLASHGYVVVAPDHEGTILLFLDWDEMDRHILERPDDVRFAVDEVLRRSDGGDPLLGGLIASDRYALIGHSFGSVTGLALGGAEPDFTAAAAACEGSDLQGCDYLPTIDPADVPGHGTRDERIEAMVLMSVGGWYAFGADGANLANTVPSLVLGGDADDVLSYEPEQRPTWDRLGAPTSFGTLANAGHYAAFSDMCTLIPVFEDCVGAEEGFLTADVGQAITRHLVTAWIGARWRGDARDEAALSPDALAAFAPLTWEAR